MVRGRTIVAIVAGVAAALGPGSARAEEGPRETVEAANGRIQKVLAKSAPEGSPAAARQEAELKQVVSELLDLEQMAEDALGREWEKRSPTERSEYTKLLTSLVERSYLRQARTNHEYTVSFEDPSPGRWGRVEVPSKVRVERRGRLETVEIIYTMFQKAGRWKVVDIETDGVSTVRNYRSQFRRIIDQDGFESLLDRMRKRLAEGEVDL